MFVGRAFTLNSVLRFLRESKRYETSRGYAMNTVLGFEQYTQTEHCVSCRDITNIPKDAPVDSSLRKGNYVEGAGQLCENCATTLYGPYGPQGPVHRSDEP